MCFRIKDSAAETVKPSAPKNLSGWRETVQRAKDTYWLQRRHGKSENDALIAAIDDALRD